MSHSHKHATKEHKFGATLHKAEGRQLEHFLRDRSMELDKEIAALQGRLGSTAMNMNISGRGLTALDAIETGFRSQTIGGGANVNFAAGMPDSPGSPADTYLQSREQTHLSYTQEIYYWINTNLI